MDPWKYAVIYLLPGCVLVGLSLFKGEWKKPSPMIFFTVWCPAVLLAWPAMLIAFAIWNRRRPS